MIKEIQYQKAEKSALAAEKKLEKENTKMEEAFKNGIEQALKRKADGATDLVIELPKELRPKKSKLSGLKVVRDHTKMGHFST